MQTLRNKLDRLRIHRRWELQLQMEIAREMPVRTAQCTAKLGASVYRSRRNDTRLGVVSPKRAREAEVYHRVPGIPSRAEQAGQGRVCRSHGHLNSQGGEQGKRNVGAIQESTGEDRSRVPLRESGGGGGGGRGGGGGGRAPGGGGQGGGWVEGTERNGKERSSEEEEDEKVKKKKKEEEEEEEEEEVEEDGWHRGTTLNQRNRSRASYKIKPVVPDINVAIEQIQATRANARAIFVTDCGTCHHDLNHSARALNYVTWRTLATVRKRDRKGYTPYTRSMQGWNENPYKVGTVLRRYSSTGALEMELLYERTITTGTIGITKKTRESHDSRRAEKHASCSQQTLLCRVLNDSSLSARYSNSPFEYHSKVPLKTLRILVSQCHDAAAAINVHLRLLNPNLWIRTSADAHEDNNNLHELAQSELDEKYKGSRFKLGMLSICLTFAPPCGSSYGSSLFEFQTDLSAEQPTDLAWGLAARFLKILLQTFQQPEPEFNQRIDFCLSQTCDRFQPKRSTRRNLFICDVDAHSSFDLLMYYPQDLYPSEKRSNKSTLNLSTPVWTGAVFLAAGDPESHYPDIRFDSSDDALNRTSNENVALKTLTFETMTRGLGERKRFSIWTERQRRRTGIDGEAARREDKRGDAVLHNRDLLSHVEENVSDLIITESDFSWGKNPENWASSGATLTQRKLAIVDKFFKPFSFQTHSRKVSHRQKQFSTAASTSYRYNIFVSTSSKNVKSQATLVLNCYFRCASYASHLVYTAHEWFSENHGFQIS
ncbi:hypothetical protein WN51_12900 [Melipona quadrifasciata]|uniref:Uncharacterized protein n=1 Tax=Melipona quadrifasciata TaxID=166423 RepID=A0A0M9A2M8_9HYME|nr:hypothetical protein WN51_12900 [Melipona quadrifasciata]